MATKTPLGIVELDSGSMEIFALDDLFLNFTFENEENWEDFRLMMNILLEEYRKLNSTTVATLIEGAILRNAENICRRRDDFRRL